MEVHFHRRVSSVGLGRKWFSFIFICILKDDLRDRHRDGELMAAQLLRQTLCLWLLTQQDLLLSQLYLYEKQKNVILTLTDVMMMMMMTANN